METSKSGKWYNMLWLDLILYILVVPIGLYGIWKNQRLKKGWKIFFSLGAPLLLGFNILLFAFIFGAITNNSNRYYKKGKEFQAAEDYNTAIAMYSKAIEADSNNAKAALGMGECYMELNKVVEGLDFFTLAIKIGDKQGEKMPEPYYRRGKFLSFIGKEAGDNEANERALTDFNQVILLEPDSARGYISRGLVNSELQKFDLAVEDLKTALEKNPTFNVKQDLSTVYVQKAATEYEKNKPSAIADLTEAIKQDPKNAKAYALRGKLRFDPLAIGSCGCGDLVKSVELGEEKDMITSLCASILAKGPEDCPSEK